MTRSKDGKGFACPKCRKLHYEIETTVCPHCELDFNSIEFSHCVRNLK